MHIDFPGIWKLLGWLILAVVGVLIGLASAKTKGPEEAPPRSDLFPDTEASRLSAEPDPSPWDSRMQRNEQLLGLLFSNTKLEHDVTFTRLIWAARTGIAIGGVYIVASFILMVMRKL